MTEEIWNPELKYPHLNWCLLAATKILAAQGLDVSNFVTHSLSAVTQGVEVVVGKASTYTRGPKKGQVKYASKKDTYRLFVANASIDAEKTRFVAETGRCVNCQGNKITMRQWNAEKGVGYVPCTSCEGGGLAT